MYEILTQISDIGIIPVIKIADASKAVALAKALRDGGINCAEITFRTEQAPKSIDLITKAYPNMLVGAGTVTNIEQVNKAILAGAKFIVSPGINPVVVKYCVSKNIPIIPGCMTPTEVEIAMENGLDIVKFFPAELSGGLAMIKALSAPYGNMKFMPTGGVGLHNLGEYLKFDKVVTCGGSFMIVDDLDEVTRLCKEAVAIVTSVKSHKAST